MFLLILSPLLVACGAASTGATPLSSTGVSSSVAALPAIDVPILLNQTSTALAKVQSLHLVMEARQGKTEISGAEIKQVEGDVVLPDKYQAQVKVHLLVADFTIPVIGVSGQQYMKDDLGNWGVSKPAEAVDLTKLLDKQTGLGPTLLKLQNTVVVGTEVLAGVNTVHLQGTLAAADVAGITFGKLGQHPASLDVWISQFSNSNASGSDQINQLYLKETGTSSDLAFWVYRFSKFDEQLDIQKPKT